MCKCKTLYNKKHDDIRNMKGKLLSEVCKDVAIEPKLIPVIGKNFILFSANTKDNAHLDVKQGVSSGMVKQPFFSR